MNNYTFYEVTENTDKVEGKGKTVGTGIYFENKSSAIAFVASPHYKPYAVMGIPPKPEYAKYDVVKRTITVFKDMDEWCSYDPEQAKQEALDKLKATMSKDELELLGIEL